MQHERFADLPCLLRQQLPFLDGDTVLTDDSNLVDYGLDSLGVVDLLATLERTYQVRFRNDLLAMEHFATPGTISAALASLMDPVA